MASQRVPEVPASESIFRGACRRKVALLDPTTHGASIVNTGATDWAETTGMNRRAVVIVNGITTAITLTIEGSPDPAGTGFVTLGTRQSSAVAYAVAGVGPLAASSTTVLYLSPDDLIACVRANISIGNANGVSITVHAEADR